MRARYSDAVFPLLLVGPGNDANLLWSWQVQFVLGTVLIGTVLLLIVARNRLAGAGQGRSGRGRAGQPCRSAGPTNLVAVPAC